MLTELVVESVGVIKHAELTLDDGSCALTGETGAGKTLLVAAVALLLGARADRTLVRTGASRAVVEGRFLLPPDHPVVARLVAEDLLEHAPVSEAEVVVSRLDHPRRQGAGAHQRTARHRRPAGAGVGRSGRDRRPVGARSDQQRQRTEAAVGRLRGHNQSGRRSGGRGSTCRRDRASSRLRPRRGPLPPARARRHRVRGR